LGTKFWEVVRDEHGIGSSGEYLGDNYSHLGRVNVINHEALGGKYVPCAVLFDLESGVIGAVTLSRRSASSLARRTS
jgi:tubulin beta